MQEMMILHSTSFKTNLHLYFTATVWHIFSSEHLHLRNWCDMIEISCYSRGMSKNVEKTSLEIPVEEMDGK